MFTPFASVIKCKYSASFKPLVTVVEHSTGKISNNFNARPKRKQRLVALFCDVLLMNAKARGRIEAEQGDEEKERGRRWQENRR